MLAITTTKPTFSKHCTCIVTLSHNSITTTCICTCVYITTKTGNCPILGTFS